MSKILNIFMTIENSEQLIPIEEFLKSKNIIETTELVVSSSGSMKKYVLDKKSSGMSVKEICKELNISKSSVYRLLKD